MSGRDDLFTVADVTVRRGAVPVLTDVSLRVATGCTALVGPSGTGKSTLLRLLTRLEEPARGTVAFRGQPLTTLDPRELRRRVQLLAQHPTVLTDTVGAEVRLGVPDLPEADVAELLRQASLPPESFLHRSTTGLSGGEAQRLCLARSLALRPEVLLLDEPTSALDADNADAVVATARAFVRDGGSVVLVSHDHRLVEELADDVLALDHEWTSRQGGEDET